METISNIKDKAAQFTFKLPIKKRIDLSKYNDMTSEKLKLKSDMGDGCATLALVRSYLQTQTTAYVLIRSANSIIELLKHAINLGCYLAYFDYIEFLRDGSQYTDNNFKMASFSMEEHEDLLIEAAKFEVLVAMNRLAELYDKYNENNEEKHLYYLKMAAEYGDIFSCLELGDYYSKKNDYSSSLFWSLLAEKIYGSDRRLQQMDSDFPFFSKRINSLKDEALDKQK